MKATKSDIQKDLAHQQKLMRLFRQRQQILEQQEAKQGIHTPPQVITEIKDLNKQIRACKVKIQRLEKHVTKDKVTFAEAKYRSLLTEVWSISQGQQTTINRNHLDIARIELDIDSQRATELECKVRAQLIRESILKSD